jgi:hypothetical protein
MASRERKIAGFRGGKARYTKAPLTVRDEGSQVRREDQSGKPKRLGRPPKPEEDRKGANLTFRVRKNLRDRIAAAARESGRSISEETEYRVESTFRDEDVAIRSLGGPYASFVIRPILMYLGCLQQSGLAWKDDKALADAVRRGISIIVEAILGSPLSIERQRAIRAEAVSEPWREAPTDRAIAVLRSLGFADEPPLAEPPESERAVG